MRRLVSTSAPGFLYNRVKKHYMTLVKEFLNNSLGDFLPLLTGLLFFLA